MDFDKFAERVFESDPTIVSVGVVDDRCSVVGLALRKEARIYASDEYIQNYVSLAAPIVVQTFARREKDLGRLQLVTARYERFVLCFSSRKERVIVLGFDPESGKFAIDQGDGNHR